MKAGNNTVVRFHYSVSDLAGTAIDSSREREPISILLGHGGLIPGVENAMQGRSAGERFGVTIAPDDGYGPRRPELTQRIAKKYFRNPDSLRPGMQTTLHSNDGDRTVTVTKVGSSVIDVDLNHPLAGKTLAFDVEIADVRDASEEEIAHRHAHGTGGHEH